MLAITVTVIAIAVIAGFLIAATRSRGARRSITSLRVTLVQDGPRSLAETPPVGAEPVDGLRAAAEDLGVQTKVVYAGYRLSHFLRDIAAAARSSDLVIVGATPNLQAVSKLTRRLPNTRFLVPDTLTDPYVSWAGQKNVTGMNFDDRENGYLGGYLTGLMAKGHKTVSAVGGIKTDSVRGLIAGFKAGVQRARPGIRVLVTYTRTFVDQQRCEAAANQQINRGSFVVFDVAGECGFGALDAARIRGKWGLGVDEDLSYLGSFILASVVKRLDRATQLAVTLFASGELPGGQDLRLDLASDSIGLAGINTRVPQAVRAKLLTVEARFRARDQARDSR